MSDLDDYDEYYGHDDDDDDDDYYDNYGDYYDDHYVAWGGYEFRVFSRREQVIAWLQRIYRRIHCRIAHCEKCHKRLIDCECIPF